MREDGKRFKINKNYPSIFEYCDLVASTWAHKLPSNVFVCICAVARLERVWLGVCACYRKSRKSNPPDDGKAFPHTSIGAHTHAHQSKMPWMLYDAFIIVLTCMDVHFRCVRRICKTQTVRNRGARNFLLSLFSDSHSLCEVIYVWILVQNHLKNGFRFLFRSNFFNNYRLADTQLDIFVIK